MAVPLGEVLGLLEGLAPLEHAEPWDNVGLLLEPLTDRRDPAHPPEVARALVTVDLTEAVLEEALRLDVDLVLAYHPPLFHPLRRLRASAPSERTVLAAVRAGLAVYSPHTALDAAPDGVNDWLADALGPGTRRPLVPARRLEPGCAFKLVVFAPEEHAGALRSALSAAGAGVIGHYTDCAFELSGTGTFFGGDAANPTVGERGRLERIPETRLELVCPEAALGRATEALYRTHPYEEPAWELYPLAAKPRLGFGAGRAVELTEPVTLDVLLERVKARIERPWVRVAASPRHASGTLVERIAVCAGSGGKLFETVDGFDLYLTGELSHHDVLSKLAHGASVLLTEHSSSERGFLPSLAARLVQAAGGRLEAVVSEADREPLEIR